MTDPKLVQLSETTLNTLMDVVSSGISKKYTIGEVIQITNQLNWEIQAYSVKQSPIVEPAPVLEDAPNGEIS